MRHIPSHAGLCLLACAAAVSAHAQSTLPDPPRLTHGRGKLLLTGGVSSIDGAAGGGLTPWAVTAGYATEREFGVTAFATRASVRDYALTGYGVAASIDNRFELSVARQDFDAGVVVPDATLRMDIVGVKMRIAGDTVLDTDRWMPQVALGIESKRLNPGDAIGGVLNSVNAKRSGIDVYISATKLLLAHGVLLNGTLRFTKANQNGLLGFGSTESDRYRAMPEVSIAYLLRRDLAVGVEYRAKPDNLRFAGDAFGEDDWKDVFIAWAPSKHFSLTAAWVDLGNIVGKKRQTGSYLSAQVAF